MSPGVLHKSMIERIAPYTMTGVIWYQGESDDPPSGNVLQAAQPDDTQLARRLERRRAVLRYRAASHAPLEADPDFKNWCAIREAQAKTARTTAGTALAVLTDCGEFSEIHPKDKKTPAHRFCLAALNGCYQVQFVDGEEGQDGGFSTFNPEAYEVCWNSGSVDVFVSTGFALR